MPSGRSFVYRRRREPCGPRGGVAVTGGRAVHRLDGARDGFESRRAEGIAAGGEATPSTGTDTVGIGTL